MRIISPNIGDSEVQWGQKWGPIRARPTEFLNGATTTNQLRPRYVHFRFAETERRILPSRRQSATGAGQHLWRSAWTACHDIITPTAGGSARSACLHSRNAHLDVDGNSALNGDRQRLEVDRALAKPLPTNASVTPFATRDNCAVQIQAAGGVWH